MLIAVVGVVVVLPVCMAAADVFVVLTWLLLKLSEGVAPNTRCWVRNTPICGPTLSENVCVPVDRVLPAL